MWNTDNAIPLTRGFVAVVDAVDFERVSQHKWLTELRGGKPYAARRDKQTRKLVFMHREIAQTPGGMDTDHANRNTLDNRRANLRHASKSQNAANQVKRTSRRFKGVSRNGTGWQACCGYEGTNVHLGTYQTEEQAAVAYDLFAYMAHGEFACLNGSST